MFKFDDKTSKPRILTEEEKIEVLADMRWFYKLSKELNVPTHIIQSWVGHTIGSSVTNTVYTKHNKDIPLVANVPFYKIIGPQGGTLYGYAYNIYSLFLISIIGSLIGFLFLNLA